MHPQNTSLARRGSAQTIAAAMIVAMFAGVSPAGAQTAAEFKELQENTRRMQRTIEALTARVAELEEQKAAQPKTASPEAALGTPLIPGASSGPARPSAKFVPASDHKSTVPSIWDYTLDPKYRGFLPIPNTEYILRVDVRPRLDLNVDNYDSGSPGRFVPALFAVQGSPDYSRATASALSANGSQIRIDFRNPSSPGNFRVYYENDFYGSETRMTYRLRYLYAQFYGVKAGFARSAFEDPDSWPDTLDYEGPNALIFDRKATLQYTHSFSDTLTATVGIDNSQAGVDNGEAISQTPDLAANVRWEPSWGNVQLSAIGRRIGGRNAAGDEATVNGWGVNLGTSIKVAGKDKLILLGVYGEGIGGLGNDTGFFNVDAAFDESGDLVALPYWSAMVAYTHQWNDSMSSTATYGYAHVGNVSGQSGDFIENTTYASVNLMWKLKDRWTIGIEGLYGNKEVKSGATSGDNYRVSFGMSYSLFD